MYCWGGRSHVLFVSKLNESKRYLCSKTRGGTGFWDWGGVVVVVGGVSKAKRLPLSAGPLELTLSRPSKSCLTSPSFFSALPSAFRSSSALLSPFPARTKTFPVCAAFSWTSTASANSALQWFKVPSTFRVPWFFWSSSVRPFATECSRLATWWTGSILRKRAATCLVRNGVFFFFSSSSSVHTHEVKASYEFRTSNPFS